MSAAQLQRAEALLKKGDFAAAQTLTEVLLQADPGDARALILQANLANARGDLDLMIASLRLLHQKHPLHAGFAGALATALNNRASRRREQGDAGTARGELEQAVTLRPDHPQAWFNLGLCLRDLGQNAAAMQAFDRHLALDPGDTSAQLLRAMLEGGSAAEAALARQRSAPVSGLDPGWLAHLAARAGKSSATLDALRQLGPSHDHAAALEALTELRLQCDIDTLREAAPLVIRAARDAGRSGLRAELIEALALPAVYRDHAHLQRSRARFDAGLAELEARWTPAHIAAGDPPLRQLAHSNFLLAYQGEDDTQLQRRYAALIECAAGQLRPEWTQAPDPHPRKRVGLLSSCWRTCTVGAYFGGWIRWLREAGHEVYLYQWGPQRDAMTDALAANASTFRFLQGSIEEVIECVRADRLQLLLYPELGMDARLLPLAALRLAPRQAVAWGHPVTSGLATIDTFLSCAAMEPGDAGLHYRERLVTLPGLGVDYRRPDLPEPAGVETLGLDPSRPRLLVPQSLFKLHPDGDAVLLQVALGLPQVQFVFFAGERATWQDAFLQRVQELFAGSGVDFARQSVFLPLASRARFLQVNQACDLMLDSLHWSGGNTALDALQCGLPLVTVPGRFMRGRQSTAMLQTLGLGPELVCGTPEAQAKRALSLLDSPAERRQMGGRIARSLDRLFDPSEARAAFLDWAAQECRA